ncbi:MAG: hypothetical protein ACJ74Y_02970, partial [Bryobacteraceae bacterium]
GFIFNNLNVFGQELAGRGRFGITTAVIQSTRMVGGMLGTALIGTLAALASSLGRLPGRLLQQLQDPELLVDRREGEMIFHQLGPVANGTPPLLPILRHVFVTSIHLGFALTALAALAAVWQVRRISHMHFHPVSVDAIPVLDQWIVPVFSPRLTGVTLRQLPGSPKEGENTL